MIQVFNVPAVNEEVSRNFECDDPTSFGGTWQRIGRCDGISTRHLLKECVHELTRFSGVNRVQRPRTDSFVVGTGTCCFLFGCERRLLPRLLQGSAAAKLKESERSGGVGMDGWVVKVVVKVSQ